LRSSLRNAIAHHDDVKGSAIRLIHVANQSRHARDGGLVIDTGDSREVVAGPGNLGWPRSARFQVR
jgi:hypothetical protein